MRQFTADIKFTKKWRPYQQRVLDELQEHLDDNHLHIIAAPGSGKTVLGLEVMLRLNKPTLIFAPTLAIRDQWVDRFINMFCESNHEKYNLISKDIKNPKLLTVSTYQGLHSAYSGALEQEESEEEAEDADNGYDESDNNEAVTSSSDELIKKLKQIGIKTIIVDEAHHLRSEWWKCLIDIKEKLEYPTIVALTATPPYDVSPLEWERYKELCGPVDSEISVPELVKENNLCPHQDYVFISTPMQNEKFEIKEFRSNVENFKLKVCSNKDFIETVASHPHLIDPKDNIETILADPAFYSSMAIFLKYVKHNTPKKLLGILGISEKNLPDLDLESLEILLTGCLFTHAKEFIEKEDMFKEISKHIRRFGAIERRKVILRNPKQIAKLLVSSISKLNSVVQIVKTESGMLKNDLRMVVLTDYIRKADFPKSNDDILPLKRIGVVPIFEQIRRANIQDIKLGILSGSLVVIPVSAKDMLLNIATNRGVDISSIKLSVLQHDDNYYIVEIRGVDKHSLVALLTKLFNSGGITVLIGTASLLGEGWDAPSINSLVLASFVGSYMLSNQMRGRAIRTQEGNPNKTSNIWHLVCIEEGQKELSDDLEMLTRRFKAFVGVSFKEQIIENGIDRLDIGGPPFKSLKINSINSQMQQKALDRDGLRQCWIDILALGGEGVRMVEEVRSTPLSLPRSFVFYNTILALFWQGIFWGGYVFQMFLRGMGRNSYRYDISFSKYLMVLGIGFVVAALFALPNCLKALYLFIKHGPVSSSEKPLFGH